MVFRPFTFGTARIDVTPPPGLPMAGYDGRKLPAGGTHLPLYARASVCQVDDTRVALCAVDVIGLSRQTTSEIRKAIELVTGIPSGHVLIATTHTHSGPVTAPFRNASPSPRYMEALSDGIVRAVAAAGRVAYPASLGMGRADASAFHLNRRDKGQETDPDLWVARFITKAGMPLGTWVNFGCHPTILGGENLFWSAEYPGALCAAVEAELGGKASFFNGCIGDVGPHRPERTFAEVERLGLGLAKAAVKATDGIEYVSPEQVACGAVSCKAPLDMPPTMEDLQALAVAPRGAQYEREWAKKCILLRESGWPVADSVDLEVQWFRIGDLTILCFPGQMFASWGLEIRRKWRGGPLMIVNQANDNAGYFPDRLAWELGGYEVRSAFKFNSDLPAPMTWEAGKRLVDAALRAAGKAGQ